MISQRGIGDRVSYNVVRRELQLTKVDISYRVFNSFVDFQSQIASVRCLGCLYDSLIYVRADYNPFGLNRRFNNVHLLWIFSINFFHAIAKHTSHFDSSTLETGLHNLRRLRLEQLCLLRGRRP